MIKSDVHFRHSSLPANSFYYSDVFTNLRVREGIRDFLNEAAAFIEKNSKESEFSEPISKLLKTAYLLPAYDAHDVIDQIATREELHRELTKQNAALFTPLLSVLTSMETLSDALGKVDLRVHQEKTGKAKLGFKKIATDLVSDLKEIDLEMFDRSAQLFANQGDDTAQFPGLITSIAKLKFYAQHDIATVDSVSHELDKRPSAENRITAVNHLMANVRRGLDAGRFDIAPFINFLSSAESKKIFEESPALASEAHALKQEISDFLTQAISRTSRKIFEGITIESMESMVEMGMTDSKSRDYVKELKKLLNTPNRNAADEARIKKLRSRIEAFAPMMKASEFNHQIEGMLQNMLFSSMNDTARVLVIELWVGIAKSLVEVHNYETARVITASLDRVGPHRMYERHFESLVNEDTRETLRGLNKGLFKLENNISNFREHARILRTPDEQAADRKKDEEERERKANPQKQQDQASATQSDAALASQQSTTNVSQAAEQPVAVSTAQQAAAGQPAAVPIATASQLDIQQTSVNASDKSQKVDSGKTDQAPVVVERPIKKFARPPYPFTGAIPPLDLYRSQALGLGSKLEQLQPDSLAAVSRLYGIEVVTSKEKKKGQQTIIGAPWLAKALADKYREKNPQFTGDKIDVNEETIQLLTHQEANALTIAHCEAICARDAREWGNKIRADFTRYQNFEPFPPLAQNYNLPGFEKYLSDVECYEDASKAFDYAADEIVPSARGLEPEEHEKLLKKLNAAGKAELQAFRAIPKPAKYSLQQSAEKLIEMLHGSNDSRIALEDDNGVQTFVYNEARTFQLHSTISSEDRAAVPAIFYIAEHNQLEKHKQNALIELIRKNLWIESVCKEDAYLAARFEELMIKHGKVKIEFLPIEEKNSTEEQLEREQQKLVERVTQNQNHFNANRVKINDWLSNVATLAARNDAKPEKLHGKSVTEYDYQARSFWYHDNDTAGTDFHAIERHFNLGSYHGAKTEDYIERAYALTQTAKAIVYQDPSLQRRLDIFFEAIKKELYQQCPLSKDSSPEKISETTKVAKKILCGYLVNLLQVVKQTKSDEPVNAQDIADFQLEESMWTGSQGRPNIVHYFDVTDPKTKAAFKHFSAVKTFGNQTIPSTNRHNGLANAGKVIMGSVTKEGVNQIDFIGYRHSSYPPIAQTNKYKRRHLARVAAQSMIEQLASEKLARMSDEEIARFDRGQPLEVRLASMSLLTPTIGDKSPVPGLGRGTDSETRQVDDSINALQMMNNNLVKLDVKVNGKTHTIVVKPQIISMNAPANVFGSVSKRNEFMNSQGFFDYSESAMNFIKDKIAAGGVTGPCQQQVTAILRLFDENVLLQKAKADLKRAITSSNLPNLMQQMSSALEMLNHGSSSDPQLEEARKRNYEEILQRVRDAQNALQPAYDKYLEMRKEILRDNWKKVATRLQNMRNEIATRDEVNETTREMYSIMQLYIDSERMFLEGLQYSKVKELTLDLQARFLIVNYLTGSAVDFYCKSGEDRTGRLNNYIEEFFIFKRIYGHFPQVFETEHHAKIDLINQTDRERLDAIAPSVHQFSVSREIAGWNVHGARGLQQNDSLRLNQSIPTANQDYEVAKLAKSSLYDHVKHELKAMLKNLNPLTSYDTVIDQHQQALRRAFTESSTPEETATFFNMLPTADELYKATKDTPDLNYVLNPALRMYLSSPAVKFKIAPLTVNQLKCLNNPDDHSLIEQLISLSIAKLPNEIRDEIIVGQRLLKAAARLHSPVFAAWLYENPEAFALENLNAENFAQLQTIEDATEFVNFLVSQGIYSSLDELGQQIMVVELQQAQYRSAIAKLLLNEEAAVLVQDSDKKHMLDIPEYVIEQLNKAHENRPDDATYKSLLAYLQGSDEGLDQVLVRVKQADERLRLANESIDPMIKSSFQEPLLPMKQSQELFSAMSRLARVKFTVSEGLTRAVEQLNDHKEDIDRISEIDFILRDFDRAISVFREKLSDDQLKLLALNLDLSPDVVADKVAHTYNEMVARRQELQAQRDRSRMMVKKYLAAQHDFFNCVRVECDQITVHPKRSELLTHRVGGGNVFSHIKDWFVDLVALLIPPKKTQEYVDSKRKSIDEQLQALTELEVLSARVTPLVTLDDDTLAEQVAAQKIRQKQFASNRTYLDEKLKELYATPAIPSIPVSARQNKHTGPLLKPASYHSATNASLTIGESDQRGAKPAANDAMLPKNPLTAFTRYGIDRLRVDYEANLCGTFTYKQNRFDYFSQKSNVPAAERKADESFAQEKLFVVDAIIAYLNERPASCAKNPLVLGGKDMLLVTEAYAVCRALGVEVQLPNHIHIPADNAERVEHYRKDSKVMVMRQQLLALKNDSVSSNIDYTTSL